MIGKREEEYLEAIYDIVNDKGYAKVSDVAKELDLGLSAVTEMFQKLDDKEYIDYKKYSGVTLTEEGKGIAKSLLNSHKIWEDFFVKIGIDREKADEEACKIEHVVDPEITEKVDDLIEKIEKEPIED
uniref:Iron dependent repressor n=1 Tax=uncultured organism TaxID=155900 RepID=M1P121_9ZZZZ|nr:iron dependent repressor [uncultured organism]